MARSATATRQVRHLKVKRCECGSPPAPRKASTWNGNQPLPKATKFAKTP
ncbi:hypothetical protein QUF49_05045 [Fictibacillus sp. b24]|nr:hypothetical protein [Fictibacillus sp. b24]MDM5315352.1 hypothetical protein [Fictibacillus sp. b24]